MIPTCQVQTSNTTTARNVPARLHVHHAQACCPHPTANLSGAGGGWSDSNASASMKLSNFAKQHGVQEKNQITPIVPQVVPCRSYPLLLTNLTVMHSPQPICCASYNQSSHNPLRSVHTTGPKKAITPVAPTASHAQPIIWLKPIVPQPDLQAAVSALQSTTPTLQQKDHS